jgi:hypothetical protein
MYNYNRLYGLWSVVCGLWSVVCGQSSWLQIKRWGFDFRRYQTFWEVMGLERRPLSLVSTVEELLGRKSSGSGLENREHGRRDPSCWPRGTLYPQKLALTSRTSCGRSVGIVHPRTKATEFVLFVCLYLCVSLYMHAYVKLRHTYTHARTHSQTLSPLLFVVVWNLAYHSKWTIKIEGLWERECRVECLNLKERK